MSSSIEYFTCPKCGGNAYREQDNTTCEIYCACANCNWDGDDIDEDEIEKEIV